MRFDYDDPVLEAAIRSGLDAVEAMLRESVKSNYPFVTETSRHLVDAGGKRFRPLLVLLASQFGDPTSPAVVPAAVAIELTHLSTLYHDDVMDEADLRRGARSANSRWDNSVAILTGDFLFARASEITADLGTEATRILAQTIAVLCEGQIRETIGPGPGEDPVSFYLSVLGEKTGSLIATSGRLGALLSGAPSAHVDVLTRYGATIGMAFQLSDDLIDVVSDSPASGKTPGTDLREGIPTLPTLLGRRDPGLAPLLDGDMTDDKHHAATLVALRSHTAVAEARTTLESYVADAKRIASDLPESSARGALLALADFVVDRTG